MSSLAVELLHHVLGATFLAYSLLVVSHFVLQILYAHRSHRASSRSGSEAGSGHTPSVDVVVAAYNEGWTDLEACFESLRAQDYAGDVNVYVVDDFSPNRAELLPLYDATEGCRTGTYSCPSRTAGSDTRRIRQFASHRERSS